MILIHQEMGGAIGFILLTKIIDVTKDCDELFCHGKAPSSDQWFCGYYHFIRFFELSLLLLAFYFIELTLITLALNLIVILCFVKIGYKTSYFDRLEVCLTLSLWVYSICFPKSDTNRVLFRSYVIIGSINWLLWAIYRLFFCHNMVIFNSIIYYVEDSSKNSVNDFYQSLGGTF